jgi:sugar/nucleoside kinase (ribokinase family)
MTLTVVGSIAFDAVETLSGRRDRLLGGSAVHFALASAFLAETRVVGPVGDDFGEEEYEVLRRRGVVTDDIEPDLQREVREQCTRARFTALDTMNMWIEVARGSLLRTIGVVDCLIVNDGELKQLTDEPNLVRAARAVLELGPSVVVAKQGEYGAAMYTREGAFGLPAYPTPDVVDPTGAGDAFAGGFMGYVAAHADEELSGELLRRAMAYGTALASFNVEAFGTERMTTLTGDEIHDRVAELERMTRFDAGPIPLRT